MKMQVHYSITTLETTPIETIYIAFQKAFEGFRIVNETTLESFSDMLSTQKYEPSLSFGAFDVVTGELVSFVLNSVTREDKSIYIILVGTVPAHRRKGIAKEIFNNIQSFLREKDVLLCKTEVLKANESAQQFYLSLGFEITQEITNTITTPKGTREICEYEIVWKI